MEQTQPISKLIKDIEANHALLPEFQRDFVWEIGKTYDLFDSLAKEIFIGAIIYGIPSFDITTRELDVRLRKRKGKRRSNLKTTNFSKHKINEMQTLSKDNFRLILDGQQRITSIYRALKGIDEVWFIQKGDDELKELVGDKKNDDCSLEELLYCFEGEEDEERLSIKLSDIWEMTTETIMDDEVHDKYFCKTAFYKNNSGKEGFDKKNQLRKYLIIRNKLIKLFTDNKLLSYYLLDMSLDKFVLFFERSNSRGVQLNFIDILSAKLYAGFKLRQKIQDYQTENPYYHLHEEIVVRAIAYIVSNEMSKDKDKGIEIHRTFILTQLGAEHFNTYWDEVTKWYRHSLEYLYKNNFLISQSWMPYENMLIPMIIFLRELGGGFDNINEEQSKFLKYWYWASIFSQRYTGSSNEKIVTDCKILTQIAKNYKISNRYFFGKISKSQVTVSDDLFSYTKKINSIYKGVLNLLNYEVGGFIDWKSTDKLLFTNDLEDHHIFPKDYIAKCLKNDDNVQDKVDCVLNRTLIPKLLNIKIGSRPPSEYLKSVAKENSNIKQSLKNHFIDEDILNGSMDKEFDFFLTLRAEEIFKVIEKHVISKSQEIVSQFYSEPAIEVAKTMDVFGTYCGEKVYAKFNPTTGKIFYKGKVFDSSDEGDSPSTAAIQAIIDLGAKERTSQNGWKFWKYIDSKDNKEKYIDELR